MNVLLVHRCFEIIVLLPVKLPQEASLQYEASPHLVKGEQSLLACLSGC